MTSCDFCHPFSGYQNNSLRGRRTKGREGGKLNASAKRDRWVLVAGVQRGGRGEVECEHEARSLGLVALRARILLPPSLPFVRRPRRLPKQGKSPTPTEMSYFSVMTPSSSIPTNNLLEYTCHAYFYYRPLI